MTATATQVQQVRIRLLLSNVVEALRQRTRLDQNELTQVIELCVERHGLNADIEGCVSLYWQNWQRHPRETFTEHVRREMADGR